MNSDAILLVVSCLGIAQSLFLCFYLITLEKGNRTAHLFLALMLLGLTIRIGKSILNVYLDLLPWQRNLGISGILMVGPFLWFYGKSLLTKQKVFAKTEYVHLVPFMVFALLCVLIPNDRRPISLIIYLAVFAHLALYVGLSASLLLRYRNEVHRQISVWYRNLIIGVGFICAFYVGNVLGIIPLYIGGALFFSFLIYTFSYLLLQRHDFSLEKYGGSTMQTSDSKALFASVQTLFKEEKPYLDASVNLSKIADTMQVSTRDVSRAINENESKNFSEFVNGYRIRRAKALLADPKYRNEKIATVAYDCGFGNVTSFNIAFKSETGCTPSQFRKQFAVA